MNSFTLKTIKSTATAELQAFAAKLQSVSQPNPQQVAMWAAIKRELATR
jgi:hypothetical protein